MSIKTNYSKLAQRLSKKIAAYFKDAGYENAVLGLSGGLDSSTTAYLLANALGAHHLFGAILPSSSSRQEDIAHAHLVARTIGFNYYRFNISDISDSIVFRIHGRGLTPQDKLARGNITARLRSLFLYNIASRKRALVVGTGDRSELLLGYFTKYGDGAVDLLPLGSLYKTEVKALARVIGVPDTIIQEPPSPGLWQGQTAESELGASYEKIDAILRLLVDKKKKPSAVAKAVHNRRLVARVQEMIETSGHKRRAPPILKP
ncbi:MAG: NAD+ synthase [Candidatus Aenigmarchaeota archaeon]|nr:NAD+ synthase [Candidatus Aenigmarchaeota archaeon]